MRVSNTDWNELQTSFEQDYQTTSELIKRLQQERTALESRDYDLFQKIVGEKQTLLSLLENHVLKRQKWLAEAGFTNEAEALKVAGTEAPTTALAWKKLEKHWNECQKINDINEKIANRTRIVVGQILNCLRGQSSQQKLYNGKGDTQPAGSGRTISNA